MKSLPPSHLHAVQLPIPRSVLGDVRFERTFQGVEDALPSSLVGRRKVMTLDHSQAESPASR